MTKVKFYLDESVNVAVGSGLKRRGVSVTTARDANTLGLSDSEQFEFALQNSLVIETHDDDFLSLSINIKHCGIVYVNQ